MAMVLIMMTILRQPGTSKLFVDPEKSRQTLKAADTTEPNK